MKTKKKPTPTAKRRSRPKTKNPAKPKPKPASKSDKMDAWIRKLSPRAQERIRREGFHLPVRSEQEQVEHLSEELRDTWAALRIQLLALGEQEVRTSHRSIMFARKTCYAFVRFRKTFIELNFFLPRALESDLLKKVTVVSKTKWAHVLALTHLDQIESPLSDWLRDAYGCAG